MTVIVACDYDEPVFSWYDYAHDISIAAGLADPTLDPPTTWDPTTYYGCTQEEWVEALDAEVDKGSYGMYGLPVKDEAVTAFCYLLAHVSPVEIHFVTARGSFGDKGERIKDLTRAQVDELPFPAKVHFAHDKGPKLAEIGAHYFLDDRPTHFYEAQRIPGLAAYLLDERWNPEVNAGRFRVKSVQEYVDRIIAVETELAKYSRSGTLVS